MKGWQIFRHSFNLVMSNLDQALRVSLVLYLVQSGYTIYSFLNPPQTIDLDSGQIPEISGEAVLAPIIFVVLAVVASLWIAVAWHRFALTGERTNGWIPRFRGSAMLRYFGRTILIIILMVLGLMLVLVPTAFIAFNNLFLLLVWQLAMVGLASYLFFRLGIMLPATAIGEKLTLGETWDATRGEGGSIFLLSLIVVGASLIMQVPSWFNADPTSVINVVYSLVVNWFATLIGISVLTTLYGHFVEKRPID